MWMSLQDHYILSVEKDGEHGSLIWWLQFVDPAKQISCGIRCNRIIKWVFKFVWSSDKDIKNPENNI